MGNSIRFVFLSTLAFGICGCGLLRLPPSGADTQWAYQTLIGADTLYNAYVGASGAETAEGCAVRTLLSANDASMHFKRLWQQAGSVGKAYALVGSCLLKDPECRAKKEQIYEDTTKVHYLFGSLGGYREIGTTMGWYGRDYQLFPAKRGCAKEHRSRREP